MQIKNLLIEQLQGQMLEQLQGQVLEQLQGQMLEQLQGQVLEHYLIKYSYNHFKSLKRTFNFNQYKDINLISFCFVAMLERFKSAINKIFISYNCKKVLIKIKIIIKIIVLIRNNIKDIKYQKPQKLRTLQDS